METRRDERINRLIQALKRSDKIHLKEASALLGVSEMTIRRDLNSESGPVVLLGGYVVLEPRSVTANHYLLSDQKPAVLTKSAMLRALQQQWFAQIKLYFLTAVPPRHTSLKRWTMSCNLPGCVTR